VIKFGLKNFTKTRDYPNISYNAAEDGVCPGWD
jgi:hypothetical protein